MAYGQAIYKNSKGHPTVKVQKNGVVRETRVWFPQGPPAAAGAADTEGVPEDYQGEKGELLAAVYEQMKIQGEFPDNFMPECPPKREWVSFDL